MHDDDVSAAYTAMTRLLAAPLTLSHPDGRRWQLGPEALLNLLARPGAERQAIGQIREQTVSPTPLGTLAIDVDALRGRIESIALQGDRPAQNPRLEVRGARLAIVPGGAGALVDRDATASMALARLTERLVGGTPACRKRKRPHSGA